MADPRYELFFAVRWQILAHYLGQFCLVVSALTLVTVGVAVFSGELEVAVSYGALVVLLAITGFLLMRIRDPGQMQMNEALVLVALVFLLVPLVMAIPLVVEGYPFIDALFETISAATTTGLSTIGSVDERHVTMRFSRSWLQWSGGLGIVVFSLALIVRPGMTALRLSSLEEPDDLVGGTRTYARRILKVYGVITLCGLVFWILLGGAPFDGLLYTLSAVSTGGFAPNNGSFAGLDGVRLAWVVTLTTVAGAIPLGLYQQSVREGWRPFIKNLEVRTMLATSLIMSVVFGVVLLIHGMGAGDVVHHAPLMIFSAQTTSGFSSLDVGSLDASAKILLILSMAMGGSVGSTAGGFKLLRLLILFGVIFHAIKKISASRHAVVDQRLEDSRIDSPEIQDALMIILLFFTVVCFSWLPFLFYGYAPLDALFEVVSATGTVGLSSGVTQGSMPVLLKLVLCFDMLLGRLEFVAWLVFFYHRTWFGRKRERA